MKNIKEDWLDYCKNNLQKIASKYLTWIEKGKDTNKFFGNWYEIDGYSVIGYYLGHEVIKGIQKTNELEKIALFSIEEVN